MTPDLRNQVSNFLGWSIFTESALLFFVFSFVFLILIVEYFGDSHAESWDILDRNRQGMISRSTSINQRLNPLANSTTYYEVARIVTTLYGYDQY